MKKLLFTFCLFVSVQGFAQKLNFKETVSYINKQIELIHVKQNTNTYFIFGNSDNPDDADVWGSITAEKNGKVVFYEPFFSETDEDVLKFDKKGDELKSINLFDVAAFEIESIADEGAVLKFLKDKTSKISLCKIVIVTPAEAEKLKKAFINLKSLCVK